MLPFTNIPVDVEQLPQAETVPLQPIHRLYLKLLRLEWLITAVIVIGATAALLFFWDRLRQGWGMWALPVAVYIFLSLYYWLQERSFPFRAYAVRERDVVYQKGWLIRTLKVCPYNRIQNCTVQNGPLERKFGLATLTLFTAGSNGADMRIPGLTQAEATNLQQFILTRIHPHAATH